MNEALYLIKREDKPELMLSGVGIGSCNAYTQSYTGTNWTRLKKHAIHFNKEEAKATIEFINNVIDWELAEQLFLEEVK